MTRPWRTAGPIIAWLLLSPGGLAAGVFPARVVQIEITLRGAGTASVLERYTPDAEVGDVDFEFLDQPCSTVGPIAVGSGDHALAYSQSRRGPWTSLHVPIESRARGQIQVRYSVRLTGSDAGVPIVLPSVPLASLAQSRGADVTLHVVFGDGFDGADVVLPRFERTAPGVFDAHMLAIPAVVRVHATGHGSASCESALAGSTGGLEWRFWIFVATMALWIPLYFWWFTRPGFAE